MTDLLTGVHPAPAGLLLGAAGAAAGALARWVLGRLRRGARVRAPVCELAVGGAWAVTGGCWAAGFLPPAWVPVLLGLGWLGVAAGCVDLRHHRLPDALTLPALPVALALLLPLGTAAVARGALGAAVALGAHGALHLALPRAMGAGDVKLSGALGAVLAASSWPALVLAAALAAVFTGVAVVAGLAGGRLRRGAGVPHGPSMLLAGWLVSMGGAMGGVLGGPSPHLTGAG